MDLRDLRRTLRDRFRTPRDGAETGFLPPGAAPAAAEPAGFLPPPSAKPADVAPRATAGEPEPIDLSRRAIETTAWGECLRIEATASEAASRAVAAALRAAAGQGSGRLGELLGTPVDDLVALDLETCGLHHAPLFLCGLARLDGDRLALTLLLARDLRDEAAVVAATLARLREAGGLITFNGLAFDVPFLAARAGYYQQPLALPDCHADLLTIARRRWGRRFGDCRLQTLERCVCGRARRGDDIPGAEIPGVYERYLTTGDDRLIEPVLYHNAVDLLTSLDLVARLVS